MSDVHLLVMPFAPFKWPSLAVSELKASLTKVGLEASVSYPSFAFAKHIGLDIYDMLIEASSPEYLLLEWIFSAYAFSGFDVRDDRDRFLKSALDDRRLIDYFQSHYKQSIDSLKDYILQIRSYVPDYIESVANDILKSDPKIIGSSTSFMQTNASLALLRRIKEARPSVVTVLGGANCEASMGRVLSNRCDWIDYVISGEADAALPSLSRSILEKGKQFTDNSLPEYIFCGRITPREAGPDDSVAIVDDLDGLPIPDFSNYFNELNRYDLADAISPLLIMETSRGCWKGEKSQCNFCGLNGKRCCYRKKSGSRMLAELDELTEKHNIKAVQMTDAILNMEYIKDPFDKLAERESSVIIFYNTMPSMSENQVSMLSKAGIGWILPGIESVSDEVLILLNKGGSAIHNIALLRYCLEYGVGVSWNILYDIPGDDAKHYDEMTDLIPLIVHLAPPRPLAIRYDRFSLYHSDPDRFNLKLAPARNYRSVFPFAGDDLDNFAYYFENADRSKYTSSWVGSVEKFKDAVEKWSSLRDDGSDHHLFFKSKERTLSIHDTRPCALCLVHHLDEFESDVYRACVHPSTIRAIESRLESSSSRLANAGTLKSILNKLMTQNILLEVNGIYLALAQRIDLPVRWREKSFYDYYFESIQSEPI